MTSSRPGAGGALPHPLLGGAFTSPVEPGSGWPGDPAAPETPPARTASAVRRLAADADLAALDAQISVCAACPRLVAWREQVARDKRASFAAEPYWGRPTPGWGDPAAGILVIGLAPAANGANRTGRVFTGDSSGDWLFASLYRTGLAAQETSVSAGDGQQLHGVRMVATVRCAPPANKPTPQERDTCAPWIDRETALLLPTVRVVVTLGAYGWDAAIRVLRANGVEIATPKPRFAHAAEVPLDHDGKPLTLLGCYHPSQHNTFTGRLTPAMLDAVFTRARALAGS